MKRFKVLIDSACFRCKPNSILSSKITRYLSANQHTFTQDPAIADYVIVNTCGFNNEHERVSFQLFKKYHHTKQNQKKIISVGCLNKINKEGIKSANADVITLNHLDELDHYFFNGTRFTSLTKAVIPDGKVDEHYPKNNRQHDFIDTLVLNIGKGIYALASEKLRQKYKMKQILDEGFAENKFYVEIAQGCVNHCSYCTIKKAKGGLKSRSIEDIIRDITSVLDVNKNCCLVADDCGCYGMDIGIDIFTLISVIKERFPRLGIDLNYVHPMWIEKYPQKYINLVKTAKINSINIPIQSGSENILKKMNRKYTPSNVAYVIEELRKASPETLIWSHLMIGFPGETEKDFKHTLAFQKHFDFSSKFLYSDKKGTTSALMGPKVPEIVKWMRKIRSRIKEACNYLIIKRGKVDELSCYRLSELDDQKENLTRKLDNTSTR